MKGQGDLTRTDLGQLTHYGALRARAGDAAALAGSLGRGAPFDDAIAGFAAKYATNNIRDHGALVDAIASGRVPARSAS